MRLKENPGRFALSRWRTLLLLGYNLHMDANHIVSVHDDKSAVIGLPSPKTTGALSVEEAIAKRRSARSFTSQPLALEELSQLLWSLQGITDCRSFRTAPSAGAVFPLKIVVAVGSVGSTVLPPGLYFYMPQEHALLPRRIGDCRSALTDAAIGQDSISTAPLSLVIAADYELTRSRYRIRTERYVHMEAGHAAQNLYLQAVAMGLGTVAIGAFDDAAVREAAALPGNFQPLYIMPVGCPSREP